MKKLLGLAVLTALSLFFQPAYAGHDYMEKMRQYLPIRKQETCSNSRTVIEYRQGKVFDGELSLVLIILEPDEASKKSQFYSEKNKDFYSMIFYAIDMSGKDGIKSEFWIKRFRSGDLEVVSRQQWFKELSLLEPNAAKSFMMYPGHDCTAINYYYIPSP